ncbi:MAG TPA: prolyl oligopeptidase family serine peptidase [Chloroflexota bacterium]
MQDRGIAPYGSWVSPVSADMVAGESVSLGQIEVDAGNIYWAEGRPSEGGRTVVVRRTADGTVEDVTPPGFNVRSRVHEYGGGAYAVHEGVIYFSNFADNRLYRQVPSRDPEPLTADSARRYADFVIDTTRGLLVCVREDHSDTSREATNALVAIDLATHDERVIQAGADFYATPRFSPDFSRLSWLTWNHPNMPWNGTELWIGRPDHDGSLHQARCVAGSPDESIYQPDWSPDGTLYCCSDRTGWWNLYRFREQELEPVVQLEAEIGRPQWVFRNSVYGFESADRVLCVVTQNGTDSLVSADTLDRACQLIDAPYTLISSLCVSSKFAAFIGASPTEAPAIVLLDLQSRHTSVLRRSSSVSLDEGYISIPESVDFPAGEGRGVAHGRFYPPKNRDFEAPHGELPPLIVHVHGGPTSLAPAALSLQIQFWTSRGYAYLDVNYGGSSGYGRAYRDRLHGMWGVVDVEDSAAGAAYLANVDLVDRNRMVITGGSAGGYTTLLALATRKGFAAGTSYYGVADLETFAHDTHKFESRYLEQLVGPYPEREDLYIDRSPVTHSGAIARPILLFQGLDDKVVPPSQSEAMVRVLDSNSVPYAYVAFEGEGHGFRMAETVRRSLENELSFYSQVFGITLIQPVSALHIEHADRL